MGQARDKKIEAEKFNAKVVYESKGKTPAGDPFMTVKVARGYYEYAERGGKDSIAFILWDRDLKRFMLINESKPPMDERIGERVRMTTAFGGSIDMGENTTYQQICQTEVEEEAGYVVPLDRIYSMGETLVSTQMSQMAHLYLVDITRIEKTKLAEWEKPASKEQSDKDAEEFVGNSVVWLDSDEVMANGDWKSIYIIAQSIVKEII